MPNPTPTQPEKASSRGAWRNPATYLADRAAALVWMSAAPARVIKLPVWLVCIACMRDGSGREIERQLSAMLVDFQVAVLDVALGLGPDGRYHRTWSSWRARRLATICILLAYLCQRSKYHGAVVWMVRGIPKGALAVATRLRSTRFAKEVIRQPHLNCVWTDIRELCESGLLIRPEKQFSHKKVPPWCKGHPKINSKGEVEQWAFNYYFLTVCPFEHGLQGRIVPAPRESPIPKFSVDAKPEIELDQEQHNAQAAEFWTRTPIQDTGSEPIHRVEARSDLNFSKLPDAESPSKPLEGEAELVDSVKRSGLDPSNAQFVMDMWRKARPPPDDKAS